MPDKSLDVLVRILTQEIGEGKADEIMARYKIELKHAEDGSKAFSGEAREMHRIIGEINRLLPGTGSLFREAFNPSALGGVGIIVGLVAAAKEALDAYNKSTDEALAKASEPLDTGIKGLQDAWDNATKSMAKYLTEADHAGDHDTTSRMIKSVEAVDKAVLEADVREIESAGRLEVARIKALEVGLDPSKVAADAARAEAGTAARVQAEKSNAPVAELEKQLAISQQAKAGLDAAALSTQKAAEKADHTASNAEETLKNLRAANDPSAKSGTGAAGLITQGDIDTRLTTYQQAVQNLADPETIAHAKEQLQLGEVQLAQQKELQAQTEARLAAVEKTKEEADANAEEAKKAALANDARLQELPGQIAQAKTIQQITSGADAQVADNEAATRAANDIAERRKKGETANQEIEGGVTAQEDIETLRKLGFTPDKIDASYRQSVANKEAGIGTPQDDKNIAMEERLKKDQEAIRVMNEFLATLGQNGDRLINIMRSHNYIAGNHASRIQSLEADVASILAAMQTGK